MCGLLWILYPLTSPSILSTVCIDYAIMEHRLGFKWGPTPQVLAFNLLKPTKQRQRQNDRKREIDKWKATTHIHMHKIALTSFCFHSWLRRNRNHKARYETQLATTRYVYQHWMSEWGREREREGGHQQLPCPKSKLIMNVASPPPRFVSQASGTTSAWGRIGQKPPRWPIVWWICSLWLVAVAVADVVCVCPHFIRIIIFSK